MGIFVLAQWIFVSSPFRAGCLFLQSCQQDAILQLTPWKAAGAGTWVAVGPAEDVDECLLCELCESGVWNSILLSR